MGRLFLLFSLITLLGCENILEIELERVNPEIVVTSVFAEDTPWQVLVQRTVGIQEESVIPSVIDHAIVTIEGSNGSFLELAHKGGGFYYADASLPQLGVTYTLKVEADGYNSVQATDQIPTSERVKNVQYSGDGQRIEILLEDEENVENYYEISVFVFPQIVQQGFSVLNAELAEQMRRFAIQDPFSPYVDRPDVTIALINDSPFDGKQFNLSLSMIHGGQNLSTYVRSTSKAYYNYYLSKTVQENTAGLPFAEPAPLKSNVLGGQGIFAGYSLHVDGVLSPKDLEAQVMGTYYLSQTQISPSDPDAVSEKIEFTLHPNHSVTGFMQYPSDNDSMVVISLDGGYTITNNESDYHLVQLHHNANTFFRNVGLRISTRPNSQNLYLSTYETVVDRAENYTTISRTFLKQNDDDFP